MSPATAGRVVVAVLVLLLGVAVGGCALLLHRYWWGLLLGIVTTAAVLVALPGGWWRRLPFALGWVAAVLALSPERPEGDYLLALDARGYALLGVGVGVLVGGLVGLRPAAPPPATIRAAGGTPS